MQQESFLGLKVNRRAAWSSRDALNEKARLFSKLRCAQVFVPITVKYMLASDGGICLPSSFYHVV